MKNLIFFVFFLILGIIMSIGYKTPPQSAPTVFNIAEAPKNSLKGKISVLSGEVKRQSRIATEASTIKEPVSIQQGEEIQTGSDGKVELDFPDAGTITMSPNSKLTIAQTLPVNLVFEQTEGKINYSINGSSPFSIKNYSLLTTINKGNVNITVDKNKLTVNIELTSGEGKVAYNDVDNKTRLIQIKEKNKYVFDNNRRLFKVE